MCALSPSYVFRCKVLCVSGCVEVWGNRDWMLMYGEGMPTVMVTWEKPNTIYY